MEKHNTWPGWECVKRIGAGAYGNVYEIEKEETGFKRKAALKVISVPASPEEIEVGYNESLYETREGAQSYFQSQINRVTTEFAIMAKLKGYTNIVSYEDHMVIPHEDGIGADILIRMELLTPLDRYRREHELSEAEIIKIGMDICSALDVCQRQEPPILHRDIKPANIMVNQTGDFKLGDFGVSKLMEGTRSAHTVAGTEPYMAPEVHFGESYTVTADIYSLGIVLYRLLNNNRNPFLPVEGYLTAEMQEQAKRTRFEGKAVPEPCKGSPELKRVVLKALSPDPAQRYQTPESFSSALRKCRHEQKQVMVEDKYISITEDEAGYGCSKGITLGNGQKIEVKIQPGCADGQILRVRLSGLTVFIHVSVIRSVKEKQVMVEDVYISITEDEAGYGCSKAVTLSNGQKIEVEIQPGCADGQILRVQLLDLTVFVHVSVSRSVKEDKPPVEDETVKTVIERHECKPEPVQGGHLGKGLIGAILGSILASIVWIILLQIGVLSSLAGLATAYCTIKGYEKLGGRLDKKGFICCVIVIIVAVYSSYKVGQVICLLNEIDALDPLSFAVTFMMFEKLTAEVEATAVLIRDVIFSYAFTALGSFAFIRRTLKKQKEVSSQK